jgi:trans-aconitate methyltransferase
MKQVNKKHTMNYFIKFGYRENNEKRKRIDPSGVVYWNSKRQEISHTFQYPIYLHAKKILIENHLGSVVDLGCGPAHKLAKLIAPYCQRTVGIDQDDIISLCKKNYPSIEFHDANFEDPKISLGKPFDMLICADVIEHLAHPDRLISLIFQISTNGAYLVISTPERDFVRGKDNMQSPNPAHVREWNKDEFNRFLRSMNLEIIEHIIVPERKFMWSLTDFTEIIKKRSILKTTQLITCRIWKS